MTIHVVNITTYQVRCRCGATSDIQQAGTGAGEPSPGAVFYARGWRTTPDNRTICPECARVLRFYAGLM